MANETELDVQFYRGESSELNNATPEDGAFYYTTDKHQLFASDGNSIYPVKTSPVIYSGETTGDGNAYNLTVDSSFELKHGVEVHLCLHADSIYGATLNVNGTGNISLKTIKGSSIDSNIPLGTWLTATYSEQLGVYVVNLDGADLNTINSGCWTQYSVTTANFNNELEATVEIPSDMFLCMIIPQIFIGDTTYEGSNKYLYSSYNNQFFICSKKDSKLTGMYSHSYQSGITYETSSGISIPSSSTIIGATEYYREKTNGDQVYVGTRYMWMSINDAGLNLKITESFTTGYTSVFAGVTKFDMYILPL